MSRQGSRQGDKPDGLEVVFKFANHNCRFEDLDGLKSLMQVANETSVVRYVETPMTPATGTGGQDHTIDRTELGRTNPTKYDYGYQDDSANASGAQTPNTAVGAGALSSPLTVTQTDLSLLDNCKQLPQDAPPRDIHSSDSHVRRASRGGRTTPQMFQKKGEANDNSSAVVAVGSIAALQLQHRPGSTPYEYRTRSNGAGLQSLFHFSMSYLSSRTWLKTYPETEPAEGLIGIKLLHGAVQGIKKELPFAYGKVLRAGWRVETRHVMRAMPKPAAPLPPIAAPPIEPSMIQIGGSTRKKRLNTAQRIKRHTERLQNDLADIEHQHQVRLTQNASSYGGGASALGGTLGGGTAGSTAAGGKQRKSTLGGFKPNDTSKSADGMNATQTGKNGDANGGTTTSLPSIYNSKNKAPAHAASNPNSKEFNRTTGGGHAGFIRGQSRAAALIDRITGPRVKSPRNEGSAAGGAAPHTPRTPGGTQQAFVRNVQHRGLFGAQAGGVEGTKKNLVQTF